MQVLPGPTFAVTPMVRAIQALYGVAVNLNQYIDNHIDDMKMSPNSTVARTGRVLEMAKLGFGIGYIVPVAVIAIGQYLLGNTLAAVTTIATAATLSNPVAMTCAAMGAIYYGWGALTESERNDILAKVSEGLALGTELLRAAIAFVVDNLKALLLSKSEIAELKGYIAAAAMIFGKKLGDVTQKISDMAVDALDVFKKKTARLAEITGETIEDAYGSIQEAAKDGAEGAKDLMSKARPRKRLPAPRKLKPKAVLPRKPARSTPVTRKARLG